MTLINVTISNNRCNSDDSGFEGGGGLGTLGGGATLTNTLIAGNFQGTGTTTNEFESGAPIGGTVVSSSSFNVIGVGGASGLTNGVNNNRVGVTNAFLGPLTDNGGPTMTHALLAGSPAINAGSNALAADQNGSALTTDQRGPGFVRIINGIVDAGAFETTAAAPSPTPTPTPTPTPIPTPTPTPTPIPGPCPTALTVNDAGDAGDADDAAQGDGICATSGGVCTLRAALQEANARASCGVIDINFSGVSSITLGSGLPDINHNVNINGPGANQLIVQRNLSAPQFRIFQVQTGTATISATISGLTASGGLFTNRNKNIAGGIYNAGSLQLKDVRVSANFAGAIWNNRGTLALTNSSVINNSSYGIDNEGTLTLSNSSVSGNTGTGIYNGESAVLTNSTVSNNSSSDNGGGIRNFGNLILTSSTLSGNSAVLGGGGLASEMGTAILTNVTIANNHTSLSSVGGRSGGGIFSSTTAGIGKTVLKNTIVAGNFQDTISTRDDVDGSVDATSSFNLIGDGTGATGISNGIGGNQIGDSTTPISALLGPLANNGGPTMTHALLSGSPAVNAGSNALAVDQNGNALTFDQRSIGFMRISGGTVDIGAFEIQPINQIDQPDFFVKQHYLDFLNRTADQSGLDFWSGTITSCGSNAGCIEAKRINTSAAFFLSIEFQQTGNLVYKMYKAGFGNLPGKPVAVDRAPFLNDTRQIQSTPVQVIVGQPGWDTQLETNKQAFALAFVQRSAFQTAHAGQTADQYVASLFGNAGANPTSAETSAAVNAFSSAGGGDAGRAAALRSVVESGSVHSKLFNEAFVLMQYFGYLQRNPYDPPEPTLDYAGYNFWLSKLNSFGGDFIKAEMVKAFLASDEYRHRFGP